MPKKSCPGCDFCNTLWPSTRRRKLLESWEMRFASLLAYFLDMERREEWLGELIEARCDMLHEGYPRWAIFLVTFGRLFLLGCALLRIKYQDIVLPSGEVVEWSEEIYQLIKMVALTNSNVMITGESGTGRELVARAIHFNGLRRDGPFVMVNCGAFSENLIESEFLGHVRGAFTGAVSDRAGFFKQADKGTIFLDEVGELPLHLQVKLLRVLEEKAFTPVGGNRHVPVDVRVICASNRDLRKELEKGQFRCDLYFRINVINIPLSPNRWDVVD